MTLCRRFLILGASLLATVPLLRAQVTNTVASDPVGIFSFTLPSSSDTLISLPLTRPKLYQGVVSSLTNYTVTVSGSPGWSAGDFTTTPCYLQVLSGSMNGMLFDIASNTSNSITLVNNGLAPTGLLPSVMFKVVPYWTLGTLFPPADQGKSFTASSNALGLNTRTQVLFPNRAGTGINRASILICYFNASNQHWNSVSSGTNNVDATPILPDSYITVRNPATAASGTLTLMGGVDTGAMAIQLDSLTNTAQDNMVSTGRPVDIALTNLGILNGSFTPSASTLGLQTRDQLMSYSNTPGVMNAAATSIYYYLSNSTTQGWRSAATGTNDVGGNLIPAGSAILIRRATNSSAVTLFWTNSISIPQ